jgi:TolB-like protein
MVEPLTLRHLWAQTYEREVTSVLSAQKDIVAQVATEVDAALKPAPRAN